MAKCFIYAYLVRLMGATRWIDATTAGEAQNMVVSVRHIRTYEEQDEQVRKILDEALDTIVRVLYNLLWV